MKQLFKDEVLRLTGIKTVADRESSSGSLTYKPHGSCAKGMDVNTLVYELMIIAAYDQLTLGNVLYKGEFTAAEMAGKADYLHLFMENANKDYEKYDIIKIVTPTFCCSYHPGETFQTIAEWEGVMNLSSKKYHKFTVDGKEMPKDVKLKPYTRCHGYHPTTVSYVDTDKRIAKKFEVLGRLYKSLTSEGMRKALSVIEASYFWDRASYELRDMARKAMLWKLWKDYGREKGSMPIYFTEQDLKFGPDIWKQVEKDYVIELRRHFQQMLDSSPAPEWPKQGDVVMLKGRDNMAKKYQGKFLCEGCVAMLSTYGDRIEWRASVRTKRYDCEYFYPAQLEPAPAKSKKSKASKKADVRSKKADVKPQTSSVSHQLSIEDRLRAALRKQLGMEA